MALIDNINLYKKLVIEVDEPITDIITCVQEDADSRYLDVQLFKSGVSFDLSGTKVRIYMVKPDGTNIMNDGEITDPTSGRCQFLLTTQALSACGVLETQIKAFSETEEQILSTQVFNIDVTKTLLTNETIESTNEYGSLVILFQDIYEALQVMTAIKNNFGEPGETAGTVPATTFWQMLEALYNVNADALKNASVTEVLNRIGESTDSSTEQTLFGKVEKIIQSQEEGDSFYRYSKTEIKKHIQNWKPTASLATFYGKLTTFRAEKNGTVYVKWTTSDRANGEFYIYDKAPLSIVEAPDQSELGSSMPKGLPQKEFAYFRVNYIYTTNEGRTNTWEWVFPVTAGIDYTFIWYASSVSSLYLNEFSLGYTDTKEA